jgi:hypothetical protein
MGRLNLVHNFEEKMSNAILKNIMTKWAKSQAFELGPPQDLSQMQWQLKDNSKMMLANELLMHTF